MVAVTGNFNQWDPHRHPMRRRNGGLWEIFIPGIRQGEVYKYFVRSNRFGVAGLKCDPYALLERSAAQAGQHRLGSRPIPVG